MENKWHSDLFTNKEKPNGKNPTGWFLGHHSETPLLSQQVVTSKESQVPYQPIVEPLPQYLIELAL